MTQKQLNELMAFPKYRMNENCSMILKVMFFAATFTVVIPYGSPIVGCGLVLYYWATKYQILYFTSFVHEYDYGLNQKNFDMLELFLPILTAGSVLLDWQISKTDDYQLSSTQIVTIIISLFYFFLPNE